MSPRTGSAFPTTLRTWLQEVVRSIPSRCVGTLLELLFGTMLTDRGMISQAILAIAPRRGWQAYYWSVRRSIGCRAVDRWWRRSASRPAATEPGRIRPSAEDAADRTAGPVPRPGS